MNLGDFESKNIACGSEVNCRNQSPRFLYRMTRLDSCWNYSRSTTLLGGMVVVRATGVSGYLCYRAARNIAIIL